CMDWRTVKFDWNRVRAFLVTAEEGSLSAAARALDISQPTLGRQVSLLEQELGVALFLREGRGLKLTENGLELVEFARSMGNAASQLSLVASGKSQNIEGNISISATEDASIFVLPSIIKKLRSIHPSINIEIIASNSETDLQRHEADIAIRGFRPTQGDLIARKVKSVTANYYATPGYIASIGNPTKLAELKNANFVGFDKSDQMIQRLAQMGLQLTSQNFPFISTNRIVHWELVKQGLCIGIFAEEAGDAEAYLAKVLPLEPPYEGEIWLVAHRELKMNRRIKTVYEFLAAELS
ncbi:LysR family transcriptional regulator, partial [Aliiglaciecola sp.]|nr:LysR family transcriptional regulator [Aliiglaciecola sp.]